ncbi:MAG: hypothetical protein WCX48_07865, partial [Bacteroidales bacterium]
MKKLSVPILTLLLAISPALYGQDNQYNQAIINNLEEYAKKVRQEWEITGIAISVMKDGVLIYAK